MRPDNPFFKGLAVALVLSALAWLMLYGVFLFVMWAIGRAS